MVEELRAMKPDQFVPPSDYKPPKKSKKIVVNESESEDLEDDEDLEDQLQDMADGVKKAIQIEFEAEHYDEASELVKFWREKELYIGGFIMEKLKEEKDKL